MRLPRGAALTLAVAALVAACGGPTNSATTIPTLAATPAPTVAPTPTAAPSANPGIDLDVQAIIDATSGLGSARIDFAVGVEGSSTTPDGDILVGSGEFSAEEPLRGFMEMEGEAAGVERMEAVFDGDLYFLRGAAFEAFTPNGEWLRIDTTSDHPNVAIFAAAVAGQSDPWSSLSILLGTTGPAEELPATTLQGVAVRHLRLDLDLDLALERAPAEHRDQLLVQIADFQEQGIGSELTAEIFVDEDDRIRRAEYDFPLPPLRGGGVLALWYEFSDFGIEVELPEIADDEVVDIEDVEL